MNNKIKPKILAGIAALSCSLLFMSCANQGQDIAATDKKPADIVVPAQVAETPGAGDKNAAPLYPLYTQAPRQLSPVECGSCHIGEYTRLRDSNSKHEFDCLDCHEQLHAYIPSKNNYNEIIPKCATCHDLPHGDAFIDCAQCHQDPHTPLQIPFSGVSGNVANHAGKKVVACEVCHYDSAGKEMETYPNKHNVEVGCLGCHGAEQHGVRPSCFDCHEPHVAGQTYADCLSCHRPHSTLEIQPYPEEVSNTVCGSCHTGIFDTLQENPTKHTDLQCASCHVSHGQIPRCQDCHNEPHGKTVHKKFPDCLTCHVDPHNMPVNPAS